MRRWILGLVILLGSLPVLAQSPVINPISGYCDFGGTKAQVSGLGSTNYLQGDVPGCQISIYLHGTLTLAPLYADDSFTPLSNPFTAVVGSSPNAGFYIAWAAVNQGYDIVASGGTVPNTYPAPQTIKEIFLGGSGGGGGTTPCGVLYDIQINDPLGTFGCDSGIGQINPTTHTLTEDIASMAQQVNVSDTTHSGQVCQGHSTGSAVDSAYCTQPSATFSPTPTGGYGTFPSDTAPTATGQVVTVQSATPVNVVTQYGTLPFYHLSFAAPSAVGNCSGLAGQDTDCAGPLPPTDPRSAVVQDKMCTIGDTPTCTGGGITVSCTVSSAGPSFAHCTFSIDNSIQAGDTGYVEFEAVCGLACTASNSISDTQGNTWTQMVNNSGSGSSIPAANFWAHMSAGADSITVNLDTGSAAYSFKGFFHFVELRGTVAPDGFAFQGSGVSGAPAFQSVTTANATDTILGSFFQYACSGGTNIPGTGFGLINQLQGTVYSSVNVSDGAEAMNVASTGTYTPTITPACGTSLGGAFTTAFTQSVYGGPGVPFFRFQKYIDLVAGMDFPSQVSNSGKCLASSGQDYQPLVWATCISSGGDTITSPHSTIAIGGSPSATTLDVAGAAGEIMAGATPALTATPILGTDNSVAGTLQTANGSANAHTIWGSAATTSNTIKGPAVVIPNGHLVECSTSSTTCTLADGGAPAAAPVHAISFPFGTPGGSAISTGFTNYITIPFGCTIQGWSIQVDAGTATVKFAKKAAGTAIPTISDSINTSGVAIASGTVIQSTTLTDFTTTTVTANDIIGMDVTAASSVGYINAQLVCQ